MRKKSNIVRTLEGRVAIVTGAGAGLGVGIAEALAAAGASVIISARRLEAAQGVARHIRAAGGRALAMRADVCVAADVLELVDGSLREWGRLDIVVHNASSSASGKSIAFEDISDGSWF